MPVTPTYPGVYIEELPSAVRTIVGVATSITAFVGFTKRGPANKPVDVFNFGDFERGFGGLDVDSPLSYAVQQFFLNGGGQAVVVRAAHGATTAAVELRNGVDAAAITVLKLLARTPGEWGNSLRITVDRDTINPDSLFNLTVTEYVLNGSALVPGDTEAFRNLTLNSTAATYAVGVLKDNSKLLTAERGSGLVAGPVFATGTSTTGPLTAPISVTAPAELLLSLNGAEPVSVKPNAGLYPTLTDLATELGSNTPAGVTVAVTAAGNALVFTSAGPATEKSSVHITAAPASPLATTIKAGIGNGGREVDAIAAFHPAPTGTTGADLDTSLVPGGTLGLTPAAGAAMIKLTMKIPSIVDTDVMVNVVEATESLATKEELRARLEAGIRATALTNPSVAAELGAARVAIVANRLVVSAGGRADASVEITNASLGDTTAAKLGFSTASFRNIAAYSPAIGAILGQASGTLGNDGSAPSPAELQGNFDAKSGIYALRDVDLFNLLVLPDAHGSRDDVLTAAMSFCEDRRAFLIADLPESVNTLPAAQDWIKKPATPKSANAAAYFPRPLIPDQLQGYRPRKMPGGGAIAGLYARTDAARGVWKAPAGTDASLRGPTSLDVPLTDQENGTINPLGLNATRAFPVYGHVVWGARTLVGSDQMASQWKYVPVRRVALFIEETLFRGTKWVVFEPNDEPLWAQIRLSVGTFMHGLFRQGAFQGAAPRQAYLVKCDSETTTHADIDLGIVNIIVGFAPLKPAEFVVIKITQLAGQLET